MTSSAELTLILIAGSSDVGPLLHEKHLFNIKGQIYLRTVTAFQTLKNVIEHCSIYLGYSIYTVFLKYIYILVSPCSNCGTFYTLTEYFREHLYNYLFMRLFNQQILW